MRWIWIDKFVEFSSGRTATALKNVTLAEEHLHDHFPGYPVMPESLMIEAMAQTWGILVLSSTKEKAGSKNVLFLGIDKARFRRPVYPGDQLRFELQAINFKRSIWKFKGEAFVDGKLVAEAELMATISDK